jgi:hypothetical protein
MKTKAPIAGLFKGKEAPGKLLHIGLEVPALPMRGCSFRISSIFFLNLNLYFYVASTSSTAAPKLEPSRSLFY